MKSKKRRSNLQSPSPPKKRLRSQLPRRRRDPISPFFCSPDSSSGSFHGGGPEVSTKLDAVFGFQRGTAGARKRRFGSIGGDLQVDLNLDAASNGVSRDCLQEECEVRKSNVEVSESSCVESNSGVDFGVVGPSNSRLKSRREFRRTIDQNKDPADNGVLEFQFTEADVSSKLCGKGAVPSNPCVQSCAESILESVCSFEEKGLEVEENGLWDFQLQEIPRNEINETFTVSKSDSTIEQWPNSLKFESDLACTEQFSYEDVSEYSSQALSELRSTILLETSDTDCSDYTPSIFLESGSEFSEKSNDDETPSSTFSMLVQYRRDFLRSSASQDIRTGTCIEEEKVDQSTILRFEELDNEEAYRMIRNRERRQLIIRDYEEEYRSSTDYGDLILQERLQQRNIRVGSNTYKRSEVVGMEWLVEEVLKFHCFLPTVYNFLWFYLKAAGADTDLENRAKNFAVLVLSEKVQFCYFPSTIAAAVVILASLGEKQDAPSQRVIETHIRTENDDLHECIESLEWLLKFL
ncbi:Cyclin-SDS, partial [Cucurbita argyrosperma subsp. sororia]